MGLVRIIPSGQQGVPDVVESVNMGEVLPTAESAADEARRLKQESREAPARMFAALESTPTGTEGNPVVDSDRQERLDQEQRDKGSVPNIVTAHADIAKLASPEDGAYLTSSSAAYSQPAEEHEDRLEVEDATIFPNNTSDLARPLTPLERAESSIPQPAGDEVSAMAATGPYHPTGVAGVQFRDREMKEMARDPAASTSEMQAEHRDEVAAAAAPPEEDDEDGNQVEEDEDGDGSSDALTELDQSAGASESGDREMARAPRKTASRAAGAAKSRTAAKRARAARGGASGKKG